MGASLLVGRIRGIPIRLHWAFVLLPLFFLYQPLLQIRRYPQWFLFELVAMGFLVVAIICHELAHALTARTFGARVESVTLWPLGGFTELSGLPPHPMPWMWVSLAGPGCNLLLGGVGWLGAALPGLPGAYAVEFLRMNLLLALFNLIPAQPLDGGHALRSVLRMRLGPARGDLWAGRVGVVAGAGVLVLALLWGSLLVAFIGAACAAYSLNLVRANRFAAYSPRPRAPEAGDFRTWRLPKKELDAEIRRRRAIERADRETRQRVDRLLQQISERGLDSLSAEDRAFLRRASEQLRRNR